MCMCMSMCVWCVYTHTYVYVCVCVHYCMLMEHVDATLYSFLQKPIFDICWCPWNACMFATASEGRVEVWDLSYSV